MNITLGEIAALVEGRLAGDASLVITGLANLDLAAAGDITFAVEPHLDKARKTKATALIVPEGTGEFPVATIYAANPREEFAKLLARFTPKLEFSPGVSDKAWVAEDAEIGAGAVIMPFATVDAHAKIGERAIIYPHTYIGQYAEVGEDAVIYSNVTLREYCRVGKRSIINAGAVIGSDGFGFTTKDGVHTKVPQVGNVIIEDDVEIGAQVGIDRAAMGSTVIGHGTKIDNLVHIGHNCRIGANCLIVAQTGISGSTTVGDNVTFGGQVGTVGHITIGGNSVYAARSGIIGDMPEGYFGAGFPVQPHAKWLRMISLQQKIPELKKEIKELKKAVAKLQNMGKKDK